MKLYNTILRSNGAGRVGIVMRWMEKNKRFIDSLVNIECRIEPNGRVSFIGVPMKSNHIHIHSHNMPPFGIHILSDIDEVTITNISNPDMLPYVIERCEDVKYSYCSYTRKPQVTRSSVHLENCVKI